MEGTSSGEPWAARSRRQARRVLAARGTARNALPCIPKRVPDPQERCGEPMDRAQRQPRCAPPCAFPSLLEAGVPSKFDEVQTGWQANAPACQEVLAAPQARSSQSVPAQSVPVSFPRSIRPRVGLPVTVPTPACLHRCLKVRDAGCRQRPSVRRGSAAHHTSCRANGATAGTAAS